MKKEIKCIAITGPTATGKTALAVKLARKFNGEILSVDSRQVYRGLDIGSGKDIQEYAEIKYHLIDIVDLSEEYNLLRFCQDATKALEDILSRGKTPILCGGTAMYLNAFLNGFELPGQELPHNQQQGIREKQDKKLPPSFIPKFIIKPLVIGVYYPRSEVHKRIEQRLDARLAEGMVDEVKNLHELYHVPHEKFEFLGLEYREISKHIRGEVSLLEMRNTLLYKIRQFAKRQDIFFRKLEREGMNIYWCKEGKISDAEKLTEAFLMDGILPKIELKISEIDYGKMKK